MAGVPCVTCNRKEYEKDKRKMNRKRNPLNPRQECKYQYICYYCVIVIHIVISLCRFKNKGINVFFSLCGAAAPSEVSR